MGSEVPINIPSIALAELDLLEVRDIQYFFGAPIQNDGAFLVAYQTLILSDEHTPHFSVEHEGQVEMRGKQFANKPQIVEP